MPQRPTSKPLLPFDVLEHIFDILDELDRRQFVAMLTVSRSLFLKLRSRLYRHIHPIETRQIQGYVDAVDLGIIPKTAVCSQSLEDRKATRDACLSDRPQEVEEVRAWFGVMRVVSLLVQYKFKSLAVANTAAKHIADELDLPGSSVTPYSLFSFQPITLDVLAVIGCDSDGPKYLDWIKARTYRVYGCIESMDAGMHFLPVAAMGGDLQASTLLVDPSRQLEMMLGGFYQDDPVRTVCRMMTELFSPSGLNIQFSAELMPKIVVYLRVSFTRRHEFQVLIDQAQADPRTRLAEDVKVVDWYPRGRTQLETERLDWTDGSWFDNPPRDPIRTYADEPWCDCHSMAVRSLDEWDDAGTPEPTKFERNLARV